MPKNNRMRQREHGDINIDRDELIDLERFLALAEFSRSVDRYTAASVRARLGAAFKVLNEVLTVIDEHPLGSTHAKLVEPLRRWRAVRAIVGARIADARAREVET